MAVGENFPRYNFLETENGDVLTLKVDADNQFGAFKAIDTDNYFLGVHCDSSLVGGSYLYHDTDYFDAHGNVINFATNTEKLLYAYVPVAYKGCVPVKFKGKSVIGGQITFSDTQGVAKLSTSDKDIKFGTILQDFNADSEEIRLVTVIL